MSATIETLFGEPDLPSKEVLYSNENPPDGVNFSVTQWFTNPVGWMLHTDSTIPGNLMGTVLRYGPPPFR